MKLACCQAEWFVTFNTLGAVWRWAIRFNKVAQDSRFTCLIFTISASLQLFCEEQISAENWACCQILWLVRGGSSWFLRMQILSAYTEKFLSCWPPTWAAIYSPERAILYLVNLCIFWFLFELSRIMKKFRLWKEIDVNHAILFSGGPH